MSQFKTYDIKKYHREFKRKQRRDAGFREKENERNIEWKKNNPQKYKESQRKTNIKRRGTKKRKGQLLKNKHRYRARLKSLGGKFTIKQWEEKKKEYNFSCAICKRTEQELLNIGKIGLTVDHKIPVSRWNEYIKKYPEIKYQCNDIKNIQPLCKNCNSQKWSHLKLSNEQKKN